MKIYKSLNTFLLCAALASFAGCRTSIDSLVKSPVSPGSGSGSTPTPAPTAAPSATPVVTPTPIVPTANYHYVSPSGNDTSGDGTAAKPWKTVFKATSSVTTAGHVIKVLAGTYLESQQLRLAPGVSLEGEGSSKTILQSSLTADWTEMLSLKSTTEGVNGSQHISDLKLDGRNLSTFWGISVAGRKNVSIHDIVVVDFKDRGVLISGRTDINEAPPTQYATGMSFYNNTILNSAAYQGTNGTYGRGCLNIGGTEGMLVYNNVITQNQRPVGYNGWPIKGLSYNRGLKIYNNVLTKIPYTGSYAGENGWDFAVEMFYDSGTEFHHNTVSGGAFDTNYQIKGTYPYSLWIHHNTFTLPAVSSSNNDAVILEFGTDSAIVENNIIDKMSNCVLFTPRDGDTINNVIIRSNLCTNVVKAGQDGSNASFINMGPGGTNYNVNGLYIYNNTFIADPVHRPWWGIELGNVTVGSLKNIYVRNNIIMNTITGGVVGGAGFSNVYITHNDIFANQATNDPVWTAGQPAGYSYVNNIHADPQFLSSSNYRLKSSSPAINRGVDIGIPYSGSAPDIGFYDDY